MPADLIPVSSMMLARFAAVGVDLDRVLGHAGIARSRFQENGARLTTSEFLSVWQAIDAVGGARDMGLRIGSEAAAYHYDVASQAALHSANLGEALTKLARYKRLTCPEEASIEVKKGEARIRFQWSLAEGQLPRLLVEATFAGVLAMAGRGIGKPIVPLRIELARSRADVAMLARHFGCALRFDAPLDALVLDARTLEEPFVTHNADLLALLVPGLEAALDEHNRRSDVADEVRSALRRAMSGERPSVERIARALRKSPRTLQRRLEEAGTSYQQILDEVRHQWARRLLADTNIEVGEVAFLLGFEELNSFARAFQNWEGATPNRWRKAERGGAARAGWR